MSCWDENPAKRVRLLDGSGGSLNSPLRSVTMTQHPARDRSGRQKTRHLQPFLRGSYLTAVATLPAEMFEREEDSPNGRKQVTCSLRCNLKVVRLRRNMYDIPLLIVRVQEMSDDGLSCVLQDPFATAVAQLHPSVCKHHVLLPGTVLILTNCAAVTILSPSVRGNSVELATRLREGEQLTVMVHIRCVRMCLNPGLPIPGDLLTLRTDTHVKLGPKVRFVGAGIDTGYGYAADESEQRRPSTRPSLAPVADVLGKTEPVPLGKDAGQSQHTFNRATDDDDDEDDEDMDEVMRMLASASQSSVRSESIPPIAAAAAAAYDSTDRARMDQGAVPVLPNNFAFSDVDSDADSDVMDF
ncbi:MAG: hypothetical protein MHM6MM_006387 [Cercozoa sp. M6MM]